MPAGVRVHRKAHKSGDKSYRNPHYHITSPERGTVGHSTSRKKAEASARIRTQKSKS